MDRGRASDAVCRRPPFARCRKKAFRTLSVEVSEDRTGAKTASLSECSERRFLWEGSFYEYAQSVQRLDSVRSDTKSR